MARVGESGRQCACAACVRGTDAVADYVKRHTTSARTRWKWSRAAQGAVLGWDGGGPGSVKRGVRGWMTVVVEALPVADYLVGGLTVVVVLLLLLFAFDRVVFSEASPRDRKFAH